MQEAEFFPIIASFAFSMVQAFSAWGLGFAVLRVFRIHPRSAAHGQDAHATDASPKPLAHAFQNIAGQGLFCLHGLFALAGGLVVQGWLISFAGLAMLLRPPELAGILGGGCLLGVWFVVRVSAGKQNPFSNRFPHFRKAPILLLLCMPPILALLLESFVPDFSGDGYLYHISAPLFYVLEGGFVSQPWAFYYHYPLLMEMLYAPALALGLEQAAIHLNFWITMASALALYHLGSVLRDKTTGTIAAFLFLAAPSVLLWSPTSQPEPGGAFLMIMMVAALLLWRRECRLPNQWRRWGYLALAGILAGGLVGCKILYALFVATIGGLIIGAIIWDRFILRRGNGDFQPSLRDYPNEVDDIPKAKAAGPLPEVTTGHKKQGIGVGQTKQGITADQQGPEIHAEQKNPETSPMPKIPGNPVGGKGFMGSVDSAILFPALCFIAYLPWLIKNWCFTGNALFPMAVDLFPTDPRLAAVAEIFSSMHGFPHPGSPLEWARDGLAGMAMLLGTQDAGFLAGMVATPVVWVLAIRRGRDRFFWAMLLAFFLVVWHYGGILQTRWFLPAYAIMTLAAAFLARELGTGILSTTSPILRKGLTAIILLGLMGNWAMGYRERLGGPESTGVGYHRPWTGIVPGQKQAFLQTLPYYALAQVVNGTVPPNESVLVVQNPPYPQVRWYQRRFIQNGQAVLMSRIERQGGLNGRPDRRIRRLEGRPVEKALFINYVVLPSGDEFGGEGRQAGLEIEPGALGSEQGYSLYRFHRPIFVE